MNKKQLHVQLTKDRHGNPLAIVENLPGLDAEMTPDSMRSLARALIMAAEYCDAYRRTGTTQSYPW